MLPGTKRSCAMAAASAFASSRPFAFAMASVSVKSETSCVVKALVEATPISMPARV